ncbi:MAG: hypothetical protein DYG94_03510 [Leptolyngbya sp. PLA3]|nr:hypothetical protein [Leptolyngbya sp. PL-A3]
MLLSLTLEIRITLRSLRVCRNINLLSIDYALRPRLRTRLTLGGITFPRKPWACGDRDSHPVYRYLSPHMHFHALHRPFRNSFTAHGTLAYHILRCPQLRLPAYSRSLSAPDSSTSELLRTL